MNTSTEAGGEAGLLGLYTHYLVELRDPREDDWALMASPWPTFTLCAIYYFIVRYAGIWYMRERAAYECRQAMFVYNVFQTFFSLWVFSRLGGFWLTGKNSQLTSLHVIHHAIMPMVSWIFLKWVGGGHSTFFMFLNMGVHVVMYFYYLVSGLGPQVQKYLWWKRYITEMQLLQFVSFSIHGVIPLFTSCSYPGLGSLFILALGVLFFSLFTNFYIQSYTKKAAALKMAKEQ